MLNPVSLGHTDEAPWRDVSGIAGAYFKVVNEDPESGATIWLIRQDAGGLFPEHSHPGWTQMLILEGSMTGREGTFRVGSYQCCEPALRHGPYKIGPDGMMALLISDGPVW